MKNSRNFQNPKSPINRAEFFFGSNSRETTPFFENFEDKDCYFIFYFFTFHSKISIFLDLLICDKNVVVRYDLKYPLMSNGTDLVPATTHFFKDTCCDRKYERKRKRKKCGECFV